jgi:hypothetical protein
MIRGVFKIECNDGHCMQIKEWKIEEYKSHILIDNCSIPFCQDIGHISIDSKVSWLIGEVIHQYEQVEMFCCLETRQFYVFRSPCSRLIREELFELDNNNHSKVERWTMNLRNLFFLSCTGKQIHVYVFQGHSVKRVKIPSIPGKLYHIHVYKYILHTKSRDSLYDYDTFINLQNNCLIGTIRIPFHADKEEWCSWKERMHRVSTTTKSAVPIFFQAPVLDKLLACYIFLV